MRTLLNVIWLLLCGIWMALGYLLAGIVWVASQLRCKWVRT
jgi:uncharacterized membrane protein YccF (DUF307 family)